MGRAGTELNLTAWLKAMKRALNGLFGLTFDRAMA